jgi:hypothetical protein
LIPFAVKLGTLAFQAPQPVNVIQNWREHRFDFGQSLHETVKFFIVPAPDFIIRQRKLFPAFLVVRRPVVPFLPEAFFAQPLHFRHFVNPAFQPITDAFEVINDLFHVAIGFRPHLETFQVALHHAVLLAKTFHQFGYLLVALLKQ